MVQGWQYRTFRWRDGDPETCEAWRARLRDGGWQTWAAGNGAWVDSERGRTFILALRRLVDRPYAVAGRE